MATSSSNCCGELRACPAWSIALDESTYRIAIAQLLVFVRYFDKGFPEDILCFIPLKGKTIAADICNEIIQFGQENKLT